MHGIHWQFNPRENPFFGMNTSGVPLPEGISGKFRVVLTMGALMTTASLVVFSWRRNIEKQS